MLEWVEKMRDNCPIELPEYKKGGPDWVPVFTADDMCKDELYNDERNKCCAIGWMEVLGIKESAFVEAYRQANKYTGIVAIYNDHVCKTNKQRADALNRAMRELGYVHISE